ncbi:Ku protein [Acuticoccus sp. M5D2P5]|uniref:non-homologous end joining protein Ku n=1 Tax=Acuticoccus kalidii TaxID=2910977 RepID=UPI001F372428|nr:Ku protein [Acuticoccus kalidii]MCF3932717.1 Ku protein [Acuticoccus kalidii]
MAAPRAYWKGHIRLALVSFPVRLYAAVSQTERIALHRITRDTHERVRIQNVVPGEGPVERDDVVMGYEYDRDKYIPVEDDELEGLDVESKHTIDLSRFVDLSDIDPIYFDKPYFLAPDGDIASEAFVTIRDALRHAKKVALGQIVLNKRERVVAIQPCGKGLILETLRWADEVREADAYFDDIEEVKVSADQVEMAESLIKARAGAFEPERFVDRYQQELRALIDKKLKGKRIEPAKPARGGKGSNVINLMDALKASLDEGGKPAGSSEKRTTKAKSSGTTKTSRAAKPKSGAKTTRTRQKKSA